MSLSSKHSPKNIQTLTALPVWTCVDAIELGLSPTEGQEGSEQVTINTALQGHGKHHIAAETTT